MKTTLILVDVINDFFHPLGTNYHTAHKAVLPKIISMLEYARHKGMPIIHAMERHRVNHDDFEWRKLPVHDIEGSFEANPAEGIAIQTGEYAVYKRRYSAFFATDLELLLRELNVGRVILVGVKTNVCVRATAQDAFAYGYQVWVVKDAVASNRQRMHDASLEDINHYLGEVIQRDDCLARLAGNQYNRG